MTYQYIPRGVCAREIRVEMEGRVVKRAEFVGGCDGNHKGLTSLIAGMDYEDVKARLSGIHCGSRETSCPDQLVKAIEAAMASEADS